MKQRKSNQILCANEKKIEKKLHKQIKQQNKKEEEQQLIKYENIHQQQYLQKWNVSTIFTTHPSLSSS